jgi:hypothetical protein
VTLDNLVPILIVGIIVISSVASALKAAKRGFDGVVEKQRASEPQRIAELEAAMARRGITPPPAMQQLIAALGTAAESKPAPAYVAQPAYAAPPPSAQPAYTAPTAASQARHRQRHEPPRRDVMRDPVSVARSMDVPDIAAVPAARGGAMRRTLAEAFGDPAHARTAVILLEVLAPPVALR